MCQSNYIQNESCSITSRKAVICELNLVEVQCVTLKLLTIMFNNGDLLPIFHNKNSKKCAKAITFKMKVVV